MTSGPDDLAANYAEAFAGRLQFGDRPALLIVDFVMAYLDPASQLYAGVESALASNERLLGAARAAGIPVFFTKVEYSADGREGGVFYRKVPALKLFARGSPHGAFPPTLQPLANEQVIRSEERRVGKECA